MHNRLFFTLTLLIVGAILLPQQSIHAQTSVTGYIHAEWLHFDQSSNPNGRALFSDAEKSFFQIRRGRIKFSHKRDQFKGVVSGDFNEKGVVVKDAYVGIQALDNDLLNVTVGLFNRPNYEVELSSSKRESPERSQVVRAFYPKERDLGFKLESSPKIGSDIQPKIQLALLNGTSRETDPLKDIASRVTLPLPLGKESKVSATIGGSFYYGGIPQPEDSVVKFEDGNQVVAYGNGSGSTQGWGNRMNYGVEAQLAASLFSFGKTSLRGEMLSGVRPSESSRIDGSGTEIPTLALRNQMGYYLLFVQELSKKFALGAKYDLFDRNTDLSGDQVLSAADRQSTVLGFGALGTFGPVRITAWYEIPSFATDEARYVDGSGTTQSDDLKDNKTTIRFQYKLK